MARKTDGGKREEIVTAAARLFMTGGFDGTSVREIMNEAGGEAGLFYYYFRNKDEVFDSVLDRLFAYYEGGFTRIVEKGRRNPCRVIEDFFEYMENETQRFREKYSDNIHRTVRWAIREHTLMIIEPFLEEIVKIYISYYGTTTALEPDVAAMFMTHGIGSYILHEDRSKYFQRRPEIKRGTSMILGQPAAEQDLRIPYPAEPADIPGVMKLAAAVCGSFPGFDESEFREELEKHISSSEAWLYRYQGKIVAILLFSKERTELDYLAVHPDYRGIGLASRLIETAAAQFPVGTEISVVTYRDGDASGMAARILYEKLGFIPGEELTFFDYPCQRLKMLTQNCPPGRTETVL